MIARMSLIAALAALATPAAAQHLHGEPQRAQRPMDRGAMHDDMAGMPLRAFHPDQLLGQQAALKLTPEQVSQLERLAADAKTRREEATAAHDRGRQQLMDALEAEDPDAQAVARHFQTAHGAMGAAHWAELEAGLAARALLTPEQRATVKSGMTGCCGKNH